MHNPHIRPIHARKAFFLAKNPKNIWIFQIRSLFFIAVGKKASAIGSVSHLDDLRHPVFIAILQTNIWRWSDSKKSKWKSENKLIYSNRKRLTFWLFIFVQKASDQLFSEILERGFSFFVQENKNVVDANEQRKHGKFGFETVGSEWPRVSEKQSYV